MVAVDDQDNAAELDHACRLKGVQLGILIEVDIGMGRCGVQPGEPTLDIARSVRSHANLVFRGLQAYEGHLVLVKDPVERAKKSGVRLLHFRRPWIYWLTQGCRQRL